MELSKRWLSMLAIAFSVCSILFSSCKEVNNITNVEHQTPRPTNTVPQYIIDDGKMALDSIASIVYRYFDPSYSKVYINELLHHSVQDSNGLYHRTIILSPLTTKNWLFELSYDSNDKISQYQAIYKPSFSENLFSAIILDKSSHLFSEVNLPQVVVEPDSGSDDYYIQHCVLDIREILNAIGRYQVANVFDPYSLNELTQHGYLDQTLLHNEWNYTTIGGNPITQIQAVSTSQCSFGAGKTIIFDLSHGEFFGWGM